MTGQSARFDTAAIAASFPSAADTLLLDTTLTSEDAASTRIFRVYRPTPPHYHATCDEHLYVLSGRGVFWAGSETERAPFEPGHLLFFRRRVVHAVPEIEAGEPVVFLAVDTPRRDPRDVIFVNEGDGTPESFIADRDKAG